MQLTPEQLLARRDADFPLATLADILGYTTAELKAIADLYQREARQSGIRKTNAGWVVDIPLFKQNVYAAHGKNHVRYLPAAWDGNRLLEESGLFFLRDVVRLLPFKPNQLRYRAQITPDSRRTIGVFKDQALDAYLVDMQPFAAWIKRVWQKRHF